MICKSLRTHYNLSSESPLVNFCELSYVKKILKQYEGKEIILLSSPSFSERGLETGEFRAGILEKIKKDFKFQRGSFFSLNYVYDIIFPEDLEGFSLGKMEIFEFFAGAGNDREISKVIHVDPCLAYYSLWKSRKIKSNKQRLIKRNPLRVGLVAYNYQSFRE